MKIVHLNTSINESSAPYKLHKALILAGIDSKLLVLNESKKLEGTKKVNKSVGYRIMRRLMSIWRNRVSSVYDKQEYMPFTVLPYGMNISRHRDIQTADVIWLHWVCGDFMSPASVQKLLKLGKPVLWTCHDNYPFTGGCHVRMGCCRYETGCGCCPQLHSDNTTDITNKLIKQKIKKLQKGNLYLISPSSWMDNNVSRSIVFKGHRHFILPNAVDTEVFRPQDKCASRKKWSIKGDRCVILIGIKANEKIPYNGTEYLAKTLDKLYEMRHNIQLVAFGAEQINIKGDFLIHNVGYVKGAEQLATLYSAADIYLVTSLEDSFNQTAAECMACGTPVVAFNNGGIADIIDHDVNGYLAKYKDSDDLYRGITEAMERLESWGDNAVKKVQDKFSYRAVSGQLEHILKNDIFM